MSTVGIRELKNRLTHYLQLTKKGKEIVVTERGVPIALIQPIAKGLSGASREARLARLSAFGIATLPQSPSLKSHKSVKVSGPPASTLILEERR
jgi:prevent-host-death family protein